MIEANVLCSMYLYMYWQEKLELLGQTTTSRIKKRGVKENEEKRTQK